MMTDWPQNRLGLKLLVGGMSLLLAVGLGLLLVGLARTAGELGRAPADAAAGFPDLRLALPPGARVVETEADGQHLYVRAETPDGGATILAIDTESGRLMGRILLEPGR